MKIHTDSRPHSGDESSAPPGSGEAAQKRAIAHALWTEIHWLMPTDRTVAITVDGNDIGVDFGPPGSASQPTAH